MYEDYDENTQKRLTEIDQEISRLKHLELEVVGTETEVYSRIVGYYRAVDNWNKGKKAEYYERKVFKPDSRFGEVSEVPQVQKAPELS